MSRWIEKKVYERLEQIKGDILFVSGLEVQEETRCATFDLLIDNQTIKL